MKEKKNENKIRGGERGEMGGNGEGEEFGVFRWLFS